MTRAIKLIGRHTDDPGDPYLVAWVWVSDDEVFVSSTNKVIQDGLAVALGEAIERGTLFAFSRSRNPRTRTQRTKLKRVGPIDADFLESLLDSAGFWHDRSFDGYVPEPMWSTIVDDFDEDALVGK